MPLRMPSASVSTPLLLRVIVALTVVEPESVTTVLANGMSVA